MFFEITGGKSDTIAATAIRCRSGSAAVQLIVIHEMRRISEERRKHAGEVRRGKLSGDKRDGNLAQLERLPITALLRMPQF